MNASSRPSSLSSQSDESPAEASVDTGDGAREANAEVATRPDAAPKNRSTRSGLFDEQSVPSLGAEHSFEAVADDQVPPLRWSGMVALVLGVLSFTAVVAVQMVFVPAAAILCGVFALRPHRGPTPVGTRPAVLGLILASGFTVCGLMLPWLKHNHLASEAEHFSRQYLQLVTAGDLPFAMELRLPPGQRQMPDTDLDAYYKRLDATSGDEKIAGYAAFVKQTEEGVFGEISQHGDSLQWELVKPPATYQEFSAQRALTIWRDRSGKVTRDVAIELQWHPREDGRAEWAVTEFRFVRS